MTEIENNTSNAHGAAWSFGVSDFDATEPLQNAELIVGAGMDFSEAGLAKAAAMSDADFDAAAERIAANDITVRSMNWFLPGTLKVTGPDVSLDRCREFLEHAFGRANRLGAQAVVFGSPPARNISDGFPLEQAWEQLIEFCHLTADVIRENGYSLRVGIEHIRKAETNIINLLSDAIRLARDINRPEIGVTADFYHLVIEDEPLDTILEAEGLVHAVQLADPATRGFPHPDRPVPGLDGFLERLNRIGYTGGISVEAIPGDDLATDCRNAVSVLNAIGKQFT